MKINNKIAVIGLGYVGLPLSVEFSKYFKVVGFDINKNRISELQNGTDKTKTIINSKYLKSKNLSFSNNINLIKDCNIYIITVPTPIDNANRPDLSYLKNASETVGNLLNIEDMVIYESTVYPGLTEEFCIPILAKKSKLIINKDFFCGYSPERLNPGDEKNTLKKIPKIISSNSKQGLKLMEDLYGKIIDSGLHKTSSIKVAEASKVIENCQRDINIAFVNELSIIFKRLNIDTKEVLEAAKTKWNFLPFSPGMVGGHCIGIDPYYLTHKAEQLGYIPQMILSGRRINDSMAKFSSRNILQLMVKNKIDIGSSKVGILGVTYKENCPDLRNSKVLDLINELKSWNVEIQIVDEWVDPKELEYYNYKCVKFKDLSDLDAIVVAVGHNEFKKLKPNDFKKLCKKKSQPVLADLKSIYEKKTFENAGFSVFRL